MTTRQTGSHSRPSAHRRSLLSSVVTHIGVAFVVVELVVLAVFTIFTWSSLVDERSDHVLRYATVVRAPLLAALARPAAEERALDAELDEALRKGREQTDGAQRPRFIPPTGARVEVFVFTKREARRFTRNGELLSAEETGWHKETWPAAVSKVLARQDVAGSMSQSLQRIVRIEPLTVEGRDAALYLKTSLRDVNEQVATYALVAFGTGAVALVFVALVTMNFLRKALLLPLSRIIDADNAARRGDRELAVVDAGDIPDDEVGAIMRSRNHLFRAMTRAQSDLDEKNAELEQQREELRVWGRDLERLVQDKTAALLRARGILHRTEKLAALGRLAANVAHEINNPLASIAGYAEEARDELLSNDGDTDVIQSLRTIEEQAFRCKDILKRLLGLARSDELRPTPLELGKLVRETVALTEHSMKKRGVEPRLQLGGDGPTITSDAASLQQVILNLVENAIDAACHGEGAPWVEVSLREEGDEAGIVVRDSGRGIPEEIRGRVFDPFYTTKPVGRGTGLGLAICQSLVERLGGRIAVENVDGQGAAFSVWLPRELEGRPLAATPGTRTVDGSQVVEDQLRIASAAADPDR